MARATPRAASQPILVVREAFVVEIAGEPTEYRVGEPVEPGDPRAQEAPRELLRTTRLPPPIKRGRGTTSEVRA